MSKSVVSKAIEFGKAAVRTDSWMSAITGIGTARDKAKTTRFVAGVGMSDETLEALYNEDDIAARVCELLPGEALREGFDVEVESDDQTSISESKDIGASIEREHVRLDTARIVNDAAVWARVFGGGAIIVGADDGATPEELALPLNEKAIVSINFLTAIDRRHLTPATWYNDPTSDKYGMPSAYRMTPTVVSARSVAGAYASDPRTSTLIVHETRLVLIDGERVTIRQRQLNDGFGASVLQRMHDVMQAFNASWGAVANLMQDAAQAKFKIQGLIDMISAGNEAVLQKRMAIVDYNRSVSRAVLLDAELEDFTRDAYSFAGVPDLLDRWMLRMAAAARMPVTMLMGQSPAGMDATGASDRQIWFDTVSAYQSNKIAPAIERITKLITLAKNGPTSGIEPASWSICFRPLWQMTEKETAELRKLNAEADHIYITDQVVTPEEVAVSRFGEAGYTGETSIDLSAREAMLEANADPNGVDLSAGTATGTPTGKTADPTEALNGAQVASLLDIVDRVARRTLPRESGIALMIVAFPISVESAEKAMGAVGRTFFIDAVVPPGA